MCVHACVYFCVRFFLLTVRSLFAAIFEAIVRKINFCEGFMIIKSTKSLNDFDVIFKLALLSAIVIILQIGSKFESGEFAMSFRLII